MITAMTETILIIVTLVLAAVALGYHTFRVIQSDGYGSSRPQPPASHPRDTFDPSSRRAGLA